MTAHGLLELVLEVKDIRQSLSFYGELLELPVVERWPEPRVAAWLSIGRNAVLGLWPPGSGGEGVALAGSRGGAHVHFAIYVEPGSLPEWKRRLEEAGIAVAGPMEFNQGKQSLFASDPDGNVVELADWPVDWAGQPIEQAEC